MKRSILLCTIVLLASFFTMESFAQTVKIKRVPMSSTGLTAFYAPGKAPAGTFQVYTGLRTVGKGQNIYLNADTTGTVPSLTWSFVEKPNGSQANFISAAGKPTVFTPDVIGRYIVKLEGAGKTAIDTFFVSTFMGTFYSRLLDAEGNIQPGCGTCHKDKYDAWKQTNHATIFKRGISGQLEVEAGKGAYGGNCFKCHTEGYDQTLDNGNFGFLAHKSGFDTTWYKTLEYRGGDYWTTSGDLTNWNSMKAMDPNMEGVATIGCESCHGAGADHNGNVNKISYSIDAGVCLTCHDAMTHHRLGYYYNASAHAMWENGSHTAQTGCYPCHSGLAFQKWVDKGKPAMTDKSMYSTNGVEEGNVALTCAACHDPHGNGNPNQIRTMSTPPLKNGFVINGGGKGAICMNCHSSRYDVATKVTDKAPLYGFAAHYGPHGNPQADMYFGQNAYQFGQTMDNYTTHAFMDDACATCHMQERTEAGATITNHEWTMTTSEGKDRVEICQRCHGSSIEEFGDIKGLDYDGNGKVEGVKTEVANMMATLKAKLPQKNGDVIANVADTAGIKLSKQVMGALYDYLYVLNDKSGGMHNTKYTTAILRAAIASFNPTGVAVRNNEMPKSFDLSQNYPNPFNPSTQIAFSVPSAARVQLNVYNIVGQLVATLVNGEFVPGNYTATWNGRDMSGSMAASGIYLYRIEGVGQNGQNFNMTKKMVLTK
ncbi:MAG: ammonia-forming cytochrome c nitrite reductase subunit c552 [Ignavibacteria bacterium]|nr:ammonia-forming cytochrome c nitrite reductase subunit c552 [Ignavibacteria bacterium]MCU7519068.1 ammonia-forming cytochrome c nitrite reductase subunit c552 [Ignavibacteria bacterium]